MTNPRILSLDIETAPAIVATWGLYDLHVGINQIVHDSYILMWSAKWLGDTKIVWDAVCQHTDNTKAYATTGERGIALSIWKLMNEADIIVAHNGDDFDIRWINGTFIKHGLPPVSPSKSVDTKKEAKKVGRYLSNSLEHLANKFSLGQKIDTGGFSLWTQVMSGDKKAWQRMITYCQHDVRLLEKLYLKLRPYMKQHPNLGLLQETGKEACPNCGEEEFVKRGFSYTSTGKFQRFCCLGCGKWVRSTKRLNSSVLVGA